MRIDCLSRRFGVIVLALTFVIVPSLTAVAQDASPAPGTPSPVARLDPAMVTGTWLSMGNLQRNGQVDGAPLAGSPTILWESELGSAAYLAPAVGDKIVIAQSEMAIAALDRETGSQLWSVPIESVGTTPTLVDGFVYTAGLQGAVALDARSGEVIWSFVPEPELEMEPPDGFPPLSIVNGPVTVADGSVYVTGDIYGELWAIDAATGELRWVYDTEGGVPGAVSYVDGMLYVASDGAGDAGSLAGSTKSQLHAVDAATGERIWTNEWPADSVFPGGTVVLDDMVLVGLSDQVAHFGTWQAYDRHTGELRWSTRTSIAPWAGSLAAVDGMFIVPNGDAGGTLALDAATGDVIWQHDSSPMAYWDMVVVDDVLYMRTGAPAIEAIDTATGALRWSISTGEPDTAWSGLAYADGVLYAGTDTAMMAIGGDGGTSPEPGPPSLATTMPLSADADGFLQWVGVIESPEEFQGPAGIAFRPNGEIFIVDSKNDRIQIFSPDGTFDRVWPGEGDTAAMFSFHEPDGFFWGDLAFAADGSLFVTDPMDGRIQIFDANLNPTASFDLPSTSPDNLSRPGGIALDEATNRLYVTDFAHDHVFVFDLEGNLVSTWGGDDGDVELSLFTPSDVAVGPDGNVYITDSGRGRVRVLTPEGETVAVFHSWSRVDYDWQGCRSRQVHGSRGCRGRLRR
ncbi:MAG: PQQ-binding-like beta-propeller repeat protein [Thermomicrobiales bacterium]